MKPLFQFPNAIGALSEFTLSRLRGLHRFLVLKLEVIELILLLKVGGLETLVAIGHGAKLLPGVVHSGTITV